MKNSTKGAWVIHHGRKVSSNIGGAAEYSAIDLASKSATLLARLSETKQAELDRNTVETIAKIGGLNPKIELRACLDQLKLQLVIEEAENGSVAVLGVTSGTALVHAAELFEKNDPQPFERAAIEIGEITSNAPVMVSEASVYISDTCKLTKQDTSDFLRQASDLGFVDSEGDGADRLLFNGNLFRRNSAQKTKQVLDSLQPNEARLVIEFEQLLKDKGSIAAPAAEKMLGDVLLSKLRAAAVIDENVVSNENGEFSFVTSPGAFHKYSNPMEDDAFDHAKALVAALSYGMSVSPTERGSIWGVELLLRKLLQGQCVGPAPAIGRDYNALEYDRVVQIIRTGSSYRMKLLKMDVGKIALEVLKGGTNSATVIEKLPNAPMSGYQGPETSRSKFRQKKQTEPSKRQTRTLLSAVRSGGGL